MKELPEPFLSNMREMLGDEYEAFLESYNEPTRRGLRFNLLKTIVPVIARSGATKQSSNRDDSGLLRFARNDEGKTVPWCPDEGKTVPWCPEGYEYPADSRPSKSPLYHAGLFYIQEPSAMSPAAILRSQPGERVLDLCAAPGGKSVQLAGYMQGKGLLVSNDASPSRSRALVKNLEMAGVTNAVVLTEMPHRLAQRFEVFFDAILVDAPCSGEGMFRRDPDAAKAYTANKPEACAAIQREILHHAARMLRPGGRMVYSTCTFNSLENEGTIASFLENHPDFKLLPIIHKNLGIFPGLDGKTARIWPHKAPGEGHFVALLSKAGSHPTINNQSADNQSTNRQPAVIARSGATKQSNHCDDVGLLRRSRFAQRYPRNDVSGYTEFQLFCEETLNISDFSVEIVGSRLYHISEAIDLTGLRVARSGWLLGEISKGRFIPSQALAIGITKDQARFSIEFTEAEAIRYLRGESFAPPEEFNPPGKPWVLICHQTYPLGWARLVQGRLKNQLPTNWVVHA